MIHFFHVADKRRGQGDNQMLELRRIEAVSSPSSREGGGGVFISYHIILMTVSSHESVKHLRLCLALNVGQGVPKT